VDGEPGGGEAYMMTTLKPTEGRCIVVPSPVDEEQMRSGIILPSSEMSDFDRGIVVEVPDTIDSTCGIKKGTVVYYRRSYKIGDHLVVESHDIYAYEEES